MRRSPPAVFSILPVPTGDGQQLGQRSNYGHGDRTSSCPLCPLRLKEKEEVKGPSGETLLKAVKLRYITAKELYRDFGEDALLILASSGHGDLKLHATVQSAVSRGR